MKYYLAAFLQRENDPVSCLMRHGASKTEAQDAVMNATINKSDSIVVNVSKDDEYTRVLVVAQRNGQWESWIGYLDELFNTSEEAQERAKDILGKRKTKPPEEWGIFQWIENESMKGKQ